ncbi:hypothetical protein PHISP_05870 [Aspergillus sp. HF37]|nr:hypothetical protein PHISP_05870 [Aspergillus sp. HF37]
MSGEGHSFERGQKEAEIRQPVGQSPRTPCHHCSPTRNASRPPPPPSSRTRPPNNRLALRGRRGLSLALCSRALLRNLSKLQPVQRAKKSVAKANAREAWRRRRKGFPRPGEIWNAEREKFMLRLERDHPQHFFCYYCSLLHRSEWVEWLEPGRRTNWRTLV